jgi:membrane-associated protein
LVLGTALIVALAVWTIRRRNGGGVIEPAPKPVLTSSGPGARRDGA